MSLSRAAVRRGTQHVISWFDAQGWKPFRFQRTAWRSYLSGESGLIHATTGTGKTLAAWMGCVIEWLAEQGRDAVPGTAPPPLRVLWITPLRALVGDTLRSLQQPVLDLGMNWTLEDRTSDTPSAQRQRQQTRFATTLVTTPESLSLLLTRADAQHQLRDLRLVVCDEWHELLASKRGVQVELALARIRRWIPGVRVWGLSATLGNLDEAGDVLLGGDSALSNIGPRIVGVKSGIPDAMIRNPRRVIQGAVTKRIVVESIIPGSIDRFPWGGHLGLRLVPELVTAVDRAQTSLVFTNTRSQTEAWYRALLKSRPDWAGRIALHHGSLERETRNWVEDGLRAGTLKCVVCTSSLDLGVDFSPVDQVFQVGSPKGVARLLQRAGRSGHSPGAASRVTCVPTHAFELIETAAARDAIASGLLESRRPMVNPLDVLCQHLVTIALGGGFRPDELRDEVRQTASFGGLTDTAWEWILDFVTRGGDSLKAYPDYHKLLLSEDQYVVRDQRVARQHRMSIGTITSDASLVVQYLNGGRLGTIEESFLTRLNPGDSFLFAGQTVELVHIHEMTVWVRRAAPSARTRIPRWTGGRMPLSTELAEAVLRKLEAADNGEFRGREMRAVRPLLALQSRWSAIPRPGHLLIERVRSREGFHVFFFPFAGRLVHEGLSTLFAWRLARRHPMTFSMSVNDYGFELLSSQEPALREAIDAGLFSADQLLPDIERSINAAEMGKRQFREIARVAGLVFSGYPGQPKSARQLQASSGLLYDVFTNYDPGNLLLQQARQEVLERQLEHTRLVHTLQSLQQSVLVIREPPRFTPLAFPLLVERLRERLSSEKLADRVARMQLSLERAAGR